MFAFREVSGEGEWPNTSLNHDFSGVYLVLSPSGSALPVPVKKQTTKLISVHNIGCVQYVTNCLILLYIYSIDSCLLPGFLKLRF